MSEQLPTETRPERAAWRETLTSQAEYWRERMRGLRSAAVHNQRALALLGLMAMSGASDVALAAETAPTAITETLPSEGWREQTAAATAENEPLPPLAERIAEFRDTLKLFIDSGCNITLTSSRIHLASGSALDTALLHSEQDAAWYTALEETGVKLSARPPTYELRKNANQWLQSAALRRRRQPIKMATLLPNLSLESTKEGEIIHLKLVDWLAEQEDAAVVWEAELSAADLTVDNQASRDRLTTTLRELRAAAEQHTPQPQQITEQVASWTAPECEPAVDVGEPLPDTEQASLRKFFNNHPWFEVFYIPYDYYAEDEQLLIVDEKMLTDDSGQLCSFRINGIITHLDATLVTNHNRKEDDESYTTFTDALIDNIYDEHNNIRTLRRFGGGRTIASTHFQVEYADPHTSAATTSYRQAEVDLPGILKTENLLQEKPVAWSRTIETPDGEPLEVYEYGPGRSVPDKIVQQIASGVGSAEKAFETDVIERLVLSPALNPNAYFSRLNPDTITMYKSILTNETIARVAARHETGHALYTRHNISLDDFLAAEEASHGRVMNLFNESESITGAIGGHVFDNGSELFTSFLNTMLEFHSEVDWQRWLAKRPAAVPALHRLLPAVIDAIKTAQPSSNPPVLDFLQQRLDTLP